MSNVVRGLCAQLSGSYCPLPVLILLVNGRPGRESQSVVGMVGQCRGGGCARGALGQHEEGQQVAFAIGVSESRSGQWSDGGMVGDRETAS